MARRDLVSEVKALLVNSVHGCTLVLALKYIFIPFTGQIGRFVFFTTII